MGPGPTAVCKRQVSMRTTIKPDGEHDAAQRGEMARYSEDGKPVHAEHNSNAMGDEEGQIRGDASEHKQGEAALHASIEQFRTSVETLLDGFAIFSAIRDEAGGILDFRYEYINEAGCRLNQRSRAEHIGHTLLELLPMHKETGLFDEYVRVVESGEALIKESLLYEDLYGSGQRLSRAFDIRAMKSGDGFAAHWRDVSERKSLEQSESEQRILAETLRDIATVLNSSLRSEEVLDQILLQLARVVPYDTASLMLVEQGVAYVARCRGYRERGLAEPSAAHRLDVAKTKNLQWMAQHGRPQAIPDTSQSAEWKRLPGSDWIKSYAGAPLQAKGETLGFLNVNSASPGSYNQEVADQLQTFADHAAIALENARLYAEEQRRANELDELRATIADLSAELELPRLLQAILERATRLLHASGGDLGLYHKARKEILIVASHHMGKDYAGTFMAPGEGVMGRVAETGKPLIVDDYPRWEGRSPQYPDGHWQTALAVPMLIGDRLVGVIGIVDDSPERRFSDSDLRLLTLFAQQSAIAVENARLFEEVQHFARRQALLNDITHTAVRAPDKANLLQRLADRLGELIQADGAYLTLWDEAQQKAIPAAAYGPIKEVYRSLETQQGETTLTESVLKSGKVMAVADVSNSPYISRRMAAQFPARSLLGLPLIADGRKLGAAFMSFNRPHTFTGEEIDIARQAADQIALAVEKAHLLESERERSALLTRANALILALGHVAAKIESASDPDEVMSTLGSELHKLKIECLIALVSEENEELGLRYISLPARVVTLAEKIAGVKMREFPLSRERFYAHDEVIGRKQAVFSGLENVMGAALPGLAANLMRRFIKVIGVSGATRVILLPLVAREKILGTLWMWGNELNESDLPAANVFASQVAISLENARLYREIQRLAITDELTGLYNRRGIMELGEREFERAARHNRPLSVVLMDIDHFKNVNDSHGHAAGDQVLRVLGEECRRHVRGTDLVGRFGGEELLLLLPETKIKAAYEAAERLRRLIEEMEVQSEQSSIKITISLGVAERKGNMEELAELIRQADEALYAAKEGGRNRVAAR